mgnify:CR=1 FL=1
MKQTTTLSIIIWVTTILWTIVWIHWKMYWFIIIAWFIAITQEIICYVIRRR